VAAADRHCVPSPSGWLNCLIETDPDPLGERRPLILIHGWKPEGIPGVPQPEVWTNFLAYFNATPSLKSAFKPYWFSYYSNDVTVPALAGSLTEALDLAGVADPSGFAARPLVVVAHSMGGLVARSYMQEHAQQVGAFAGQPGGARVVKLITLGTPHHGSPMANGPARDARAGLGWGSALGIFDDLFFSQIGPSESEVNRSDLRWDDYDGLLDYARFAAERNPWLVGLNGVTTYDAKILGYFGRLSPTTFCEFDKYCWGAVILDQAFGLPSDGVVPLTSAVLVNGANQSRIASRFFPGYNHDQLAMGRGDRVLFDQLAADLRALAPVPPPPSDVTLPAVTITSPTSGTTFSTASGLLILGGTASDDVGVTLVTWTSDRGGSGAASGTTSWTVSGIPLQSGTNVITVKAWDAAGGSGTDTLTVTYTPPKRRHRTAARHF
jgi:pimeloyl-ACP methyl ester carboxylesterase